MSLRNDEIGTCLYISEDTVKTHLRRAFSDLNIPRRAAASTALFKSGVYNLAAPADRLGLTPAEQPVVKLISNGLSNNAIGLQLELSPVTIKSHIVRIARRTGFHGRELIGLAALASGEVELQHTIKTPASISINSNEND